MTQANATNYFSPAKWVVSKTAAEGTHTTIGGALSAASSGDTIFVMPGTYTEDNTVGMSCNIVGQGGDSNGQVIVNGKFTVTGAYTVNLSNLELQTNSNYAVEVTGSAASIVNIYYCNINCSNNTGIHYTSSSSSSGINIYHSKANLGTTGIALFAHSSAGTLDITYTITTNSGGSSTASTISGTGVLNLSYNRMTDFFTASSSSAGIWMACSFSTTNQTILTTSSTASFNIWHSQFISGSATAISIGSGTTVSTYACYVSSSATDAISGAGTHDFSCLVFQGGTTYLNNTTTQNGGIIQGIRAGNAPSAGYIGERVSTGNIGLTNLSGTNMLTNIGNISLTAGVWDISLICQFQGITTGTALLANIGTSTGDGGSGGDSLASLQITSLSVVADTLSIPAYRVTISSTTSYYFNAKALYTVGTGQAGGRMSAVRVG